jgi:chromosome segregation ATPase
LQVQVAATGETQDRKTQTSKTCVIAIKAASVVSTNSEGWAMQNKLQSDDDLMEVFQRHYADLRREHSEYQAIVHKLECEVAGLRGRIDQLDELNKRLTEERDQFLERYCRLVTQFELIGGGVDRARANVSDTIGLLRRKPEKHEPHELPSLPAAKSLSNVNGQLEDGIAKITATLGGEHRSAAE